MTHRTPPTLATSLLKMFGADSALVGDVGEGYESGKSRWWYWQQVLAIIAASTATEVRRHPTITMRAIALGFAFTWVMWSYVMFAVLNYDELLFTTGLVPWFYSHGYSLPRLAIWPATALLYGLSGWIVGRASHESAAIVLVYVGVVEFVWLAFGVWRFVHDPLPHSLMAILTVGLRPIPTFFGGLWAVSRGHSAERHVHA